MFLFNSNNNNNKTTKQTTISINTDNCGCVRDYRRDAVMLFKMKTLVITSTDNCDYATITLMQRWCPKWPRSSSLVTTTVIRLYHYAADNNDYICHCVAGNNEYAIVLLITMTIIVLLISMIMWIHDCAFDNNDNNEYIIVLLITMTMWLYHCAADNDDYVTISLRCW